MHVFVQLRRAFVPLSLPSGEGLRAVRVLLGAAGGELISSFLVPSEHVVLGELEDVQDLLLDLLPAQSPLKQGLVVIVHTLALPHLHLYVILNP